MLTLEKHMREISLASWRRPRPDHFDPNEPRTFEIHMENYRYELVMISGGNFHGEFAAMVHESVTDQAQMQRCVIGAVLANLIVHGISNHPALGAAPTR